MMWLTGSFALVALLVAAVGIYGVLSYTMSQRTQEVGIRIALGADASAGHAHGVGEGAKLVGIAVVAGLLTSAGAARLLRNQLFGVAAERRGDVRRRHRGAVGRRDPRVLHPRASSEPSGSDGRVAVGLDGVISFCRSAPFSSER